MVLSDDTSGPVTGMAISSVEKFLTYGMLGNRDGRGGKGSIRRSHVFYTRDVCCDNAQKDSQLFSTHARMS